MSDALIGALLDELELSPDHLDRLARLLADRLPATGAPPASPYLNATEAAAYLRCDRQRIYDLRHAGQLEPRRDGSRLLFHRDTLDAYLARETQT